MNYDNTKSPVGWYVGTYQLRFIELGQSDNENPEGEFLTWENTVLVKAATLEEAYDKVVATGMKETEPYKGGPNGVDVQWLFEGVIELLPIFEEIEDGAEIMWAERTKKLKNIQSQSKSKEELYKCLQKAQQGIQPDA
ncbi:MAG: DUF4288 domain-containing protein [Gammaproteobacteria bacterium]|nr:DUF4288 domain-containing protein [Gammaproteobacteria bacterium]